MAELRVVPPHAVDRPALRARLDVGLHAPLILVVAPAGYGKSVLLSQWVRSRDDLAVVWVDVTAADDDAAAFALRLVAAIAEADPRMRDPGVPVGTAGGGLGESYVEALAGSLALLGELVVVFDDLHHLAASEIVIDLWRLVDLLPPQVHFVFSTRADAKLARSRHRLEHAIVELRQANLAFSDHETGALLERITGRSVPAHAASSIARHTEGWAAGVQLSGLTLRFEEDIDRFADRLDETDRLIVEYLSEEVLDAQTASRRAALLQLSVLDEVSGGLVEAVADVADGEELLAELVRESMFLVPVPDRRGWYRFHHLFRDLLRYRLRVADPDAERRLLSAAGEWHLTWGDRATAVEYLLRAREWQRVFDLLLASGRDVYDQVRTTTVARWLSLVPAEVRETNTDIQLLYAIVAGMSGRGAFAMELLQGLLVSGRLDAGARQVALTYLALGAQFLPHPEFFLDVGEKAVAALDADPQATVPVLLQLTHRPLLETASLTAIGRAHLLLGDLGAARDVFGRALQTAGANYGAYRVHLLGSLAMVEAWSGRLDLSLDLASEALELAREHALLSHPAPADAYLARAVASVQRGEPEAGALALHEGTIRAAANQRTQLMWIAALAAVLIDPERSDPATIEPAGPPPPLVQRAYAAYEWRIDRLRGRPRPRPSIPETLWSTLAFEHIAAALARGDLGSARTMLASARLSTDPLSPVMAVEHGVALAWLSLAEGRTSESRSHLQTVLDLAEAEDLAYPIVRMGPVVADLMAGLPGRPSPFRQHILERVGPPPRAALPALTEPLTARELEILAYLPSRLTNTELAARYFVSVNTIKTHVGHIYRKLDVAGRDAAIARARELGLLSSAEIAHAG